MVQQVNAHLNGITGAIKAKYLYASDGTKLKVQDSGNTSGYDYLGSVTLVKDTSGTTPEAAFAEGIIRGSNILFFEKDHLGSVRAVLNTTGGAPQYIDYYPFGTQYTGQIDNVNRYRFNGKEIQLIGGFDLLDFNTRMYDQELGRFHNMDWLVEEFPHQSPFAFADNNPVRYIDFMGMNALESKYFTEEGELLLETDDSHPDRIIIVPDKDLKDFKRHIELTSEEFRSSDGWNNYWAEEFGEFVLTPDEQTSVNSFHSSKAQNAAIGYIINPSQSNYWRMVGAEMAAQWTTPELVVAGLSVGVSMIGRGGVNPNVRTSNIRNSTVNTTKKYTRHGLNQAISRNGGRGVHPAAINDALRNPIKVVPQSGGRTKYVGQNATVVLNSNGKIITTYGQPRNP